MFLFILGIIIISFSPIGVKGITDLGPTSIALYRCFIGTIALFPLFIAPYLKGNGSKIGKEIFYLLISGFFFSLDLFFWNRSVIYVGAGLSTILGNTQAIYMALFGILISKEKVSKLFLFSLPIAFIGILLITDLKGGHEMAPNYNEGVIFGLLTGIFYCGFVLALRKAGKINESLTAAQKMFFVSLFTALFLFIFSLIEKGGVESFGSYQNLVILLILGGGIHTLGWMLITKSLSKIPIAISGLMMLIQPTLSTIWGMVIFGEILYPMQMGGALLTLSAIYLGSGSATYLLSKIKRKPKVS